MHTQDIIYCYYLLLSVCGEINSVTESIIMNQFEAFSSFLVSLWTLFTVHWLHSFHNVNVFIWIQATYVTEKCSITALVMLHWTVWEADCIGLNWKEWGENGHGIIPEFYQKSGGKPHSSYMVSQWRIKPGTTELEAESTTDWATLLVSFARMKSQIVRTFSTQESLTLKSLML